MLRRANFGTLIHTKVLCIVQRRGELPVTPGVRQVLLNHSKGVLRLRDGERPRSTVTVNLHTQQPLQRATVINGQGGSEEVGEAPATTIA